MSTVHLPHPIQTPSPGEKFYPDTDPEPMADYPVQMLAMATLIFMLRAWFRDRPDIYVIGNVFWYYEEGNPLARKAPDVMVIKGVEPERERVSYKDWEGGVRPCFLLEILSQDTFKEDMGEKRDLYERLGVHEYFLFDPLGLGLERPLVGYRLIQRVHEELQPAADGSLPSSELRLRLRPEGDLLALFNSRTGQRLLNPQTLAQQLPEVQRELQETTRAREEERREKEEALRQTAEIQKHLDEILRQVERERAEREQALRHTSEVAEQERHAKEEALLRAEQDRLDKEAMAQELVRLRALLATQTGPGRQDAAPGSTP